MKNKNINNKTKETKNMNPVTKYIIMTLVAVGVTGGAIFGIYKHNEIQKAAQ